MAELSPSGTNAGPHRARRYSGAGLPDDVSTVEQTKQWVGDDLRRAQTALDAETAKPEDDQRSTLIDHLEGMLTEPDETEQPDDNETPSDAPADEEQPPSSDDD